MVTHWIFQRSHWISIAPANVIFRREFALLLVGQHTAHFTPFAKPKLRWDGPVRRLARCVEGEE